MKVKELIEKLKEHDQDRVVVMSKDGEGNEYSPLANMGTASYVAESTWSGYIGLEPGDLDDEAIAQGYTEEDVKNGEPALVLWPTN